MGNYVLHVIVLSYAFFHICVYTCIYCMYLMCIYFVFTAVSWELGPHFGYWCVYLGSVPCTCFAKSNFIQYVPFYFFICVVYSFILYLQWCSVLRCQYMCNISWMQ